MSWAAKQPWAPGTCSTRALFPIAAHLSQARFQWSLLGFFFFLCRKVSFLGCLGLQESAIGSQELAAWYSAGGVWHWGVCVGGAQDKPVNPAFSSQQHGATLLVLLLTRVSAEKTLLLLQV